MTKSARNALTLALNTFGCAMLMGSLLGSPDVYAQQLAERPACGDTATRNGPDFHTFRKLANPAINNRAKAPAPAQPAAKTPATPAVVRASHTVTAAATKAVAKSSPRASRIPAEILVDPDVATIRLLSESQTPDASLPREPRVARARVKHTAPTTTVTGTPTNTQRPIPNSVAMKNQQQSASLLTRILETGSANAPHAHPHAYPRTVTEPICAANHATNVHQAAEPFSSREKDSAWDVSTRRPKNTEHVHTGQPHRLNRVAAEDRQLLPINERAPTPNRMIEQTSATENVNPRVNGQAFWTQPQFLGSVSASTSPDAEPGRFPSLDAASPSTASNSLVVQPTSTDQWAKMPPPGRAADYPKSVSNESKPPRSIEPRKWAGLFIEDDRALNPSQNQLTRISFDAPISDTAAPGDIMLAQANAPTGEANGQNKSKRRRSRLRLDFLDDPEEIEGDPTEDAIKSILGDGQDAEKKLNSLLEDEDDDSQSHREKYGYAYEEIVPKPIVKSPRNYAPTLKDILADRQTDPWVEQAYCNAVWRCAGGKDRSRLSQWNEQLDRNKQVLWGCDRCGRGAGACNCDVPWGISPTYPRPGITSCRIIRGGGWCTGVCGGHCDVGCKVVCPKPGGSCSCTGETCSCTDASRTNDASHTD